MREIKYRLRDRKKKIVGYERWYEGYFHYDNPDEGLADGSGWWEAPPCWMYSVDGEKWTTQVIRHRYKDSHTGLKDSKGVEIYEGDILDRKDDILCIVTFEDGKFGWNIRYKRPELNQRQDYFGRSYACQEEASKLEIIGNIYENPELLKEVK